MIYILGHVDFSIELERNLWVLGGAILVLCAVAGVQVRDSLCSPVKRLNYVLRRTLTVDTANALRLPFAPFPL